MRELLKFFVKCSAWILFGIYVILSCVMLFSANPYQHHVYLTSAGAISSTVAGWGRGISSYFALRDINEDLQRRNKDMELEMSQLKAVIRKYHEKEEGARAKADTVLSRYNFIIAHIINNTVNHSHNYATIEKGSLDGIEPEMGVVDQNGIVGIVNLVTPHTARIITILNPKLRISCRIKGHEHVGSLSWDGAKPGEVVLEELPRHAPYAPGDTVVTSGYSTAFPEGVPVGTVMGRLKGRDANFNTLKIKLFTDFGTLSTVRVIKDFLKPEIDKVEKEEPEEP